MGDRDKFNGGRKLPKEGTKFKKAEKRDKWVKNKDLKKKSYR